MSSLYILGRAATYDDAAIVSYLSFTVVATFLAVPAQIVSTFRGTTALSESHLYCSRYEMISVAYSVPHYCRCRSAAAAAVGSGGNEATTPPSARTPRAADDAPPRAAGDRAAGDA